MKNILRSGVLAAGIAASMMGASVPAHATAVGVFTASVTIASFGTGASTGEADLCVDGVDNTGATVVAAGACASVVTIGANAHATFGLFEDDSTCPATGTAEGDVTGAVTTHFTWTRVGAVAVISTSGGTIGTGNGISAFAVTSAGLPCGASNVKAVAVGALLAA